MRTLPRHILPMIDDEKYDEWWIFKMEKSENIQMLMFCDTEEEENQRTL